MANAFRDYTVAGRPDVSRARGASLADLGIGAATGVLVWPFPVMRVLFTSLAGSSAAGWAIHVPALLVFFVIAAWLCSAMLAWLGHRTVGMYFADLGFLERRGSGGSLVAAASWTLAGLAALAGGRGPAERFAVRWLGSTARADD